VPDLPGSHNGNSVSANLAVLLRTARNDPQGTVRQGCCSAAASTQGARSPASRSSLRVRMTGVAFGLDRPHLQIRLRGREREQVALHVALGRLPRAGPASPDARKKRGGPILRRRDSDRFSLARRVDAVFTE